MSIFQRWFGGSKKEDSNVTSSQAIEDLIKTEEMLIKKQEYLESKIETEKVNALRFSKQGNKRAALGALKKKKNDEKILLQIDGTLTTLESQREALQNGSTNMEVFAAMRKAAAALKKSNDGVDVDTVAELKEDMDEQVNLANEIGNLISSPGLGASEYDDTDLLKELNGLVEEADQEEILRMGPLPDVPTTTSTTLTTREKRKENGDSERELEAWMNS